MIADLFLRTYVHDFGWLPYLGRSLNRHARGWRKLIVVVPEGQPLPTVPEFDEPEFCEVVEFHRCPVYPNDYIGQQISKLHAWQLSDAESIGYLDSDTIFVSEFAPETIPTDRVSCRTWDDVGDAICWRKPTSDLLGFEVTKETMCRHPFVFQREIVKACCEHVGGESRLLGYGHFSEFNLLGNFALSSGLPPATPTGPEIVEQFWSHGGINLDVLEWMAINGYGERVPRSRLDGSDGIWTLAGDTHIGKWVRQVGRLDHDQHMLSRVLKAFDGRKNVWDVGAFIGDHTEGYVNAGKRVLAIEPHPDAYECLVRNMRKHGDRVECICCAAGSKESVTLASPDEVNRGARFLQQVEGGRETVTLDDLTRAYQMPDAIKLDVEGWEVKALNGASAILATAHPVMVIEVNREALERSGDSAERLHELLTWCGYKMRYLLDDEPWLAGDDRPLFDVVAEWKP